MLWLVLRNGLGKEFYSLGSSTKLKSKSGDESLKFCFVLFAATDQQREATADVQLAVDFLRQEFADQLGANYSELNSVPLMLARIRRAKHRQPDPAHPEVVSPYPPATSPATNPIETTPVHRHWRRRRRRRDGLQQGEAVSFTPSTSVALRRSSRTSADPEKASSWSQSRRLTTESVDTSTTGADQAEKLPDEVGEELIDERNDYAERLLKIAHTLHYGSIAILGVFVIQVNQRAGCQGIGVDRGQEGNKVLYYRNWYYTPPVHAGSEV